MKLRWTVTVVDDERGGIPVRMQQDSISYDLFGSGVTPNAALADLRQKAAGERDRKMSEAVAAQEWHALVLATEGLLDG